MNSNWFKLVMKMTKVEYGKNLLLKGVPIIFNKGGAKLKIGENVTIKSSFLSNLVGLYSRTIIVTRAPGAEIEIGDNVGISGANDMSGWQRKANYKAIKKLSGAIVLSKSLKKIFEGMIAEDKIFVVENCVDDQYLLTDQEIAEKLNALENEKVIHVLWLSNFIRSKGYPFVLEMAKTEKERVDAGGEKRFHFDFAGKFFEESEKEYFENYIKENELGEYVTYHGVVSGEKKRELLKKCYIFALPTRYPNEGQPISILEAMGNGMFIITTDHAGIPDIVEDGVNGIVMKNKEENNALVERLLEVNVNQLESIIKNNREYCKKRFSEKNYIQNMGKVLGN